VSVALDGGTAGVQWHRITIDADIPDGTWIKVHTVVADDPTALDNPAALPIGIVFEPQDETPATQPPRYQSDVPDRLVLSGPGRYLRLRLTLGSDGRATPSVRSVRVSYPRVSYLDLLPRVFRSDPEAARFLDRYLALFEHVFTGVEDRYERFMRELDPMAAPADVLRWLGALLDLTFDPSWPLARRRALVAEAVSLYAMRGTPKGVARAIELYVGSAPVIIEAFRERAATIPPLGRPGAVLGCGSVLGAPPATRGTVRDDAAHRFTVLVFLDDTCDAQTALPTLRRVLALNQPAHTVATLRVVTPDTRIGEGLLGIDAMVGARAPAAMPIGGCDSSAPARVPGVGLGINTILGERRPGYARPLIQVL
jgi:phage tail-like protein